ncbi:hypothetical protein IWW52_006448, partial [Coemansia sp. RSA 2704]
RAPERGDRVCDAAARRAADSHWRGSRVHVRPCVFARGRAGAGLRRVDQTAGVAVSAGVQCDHTGIRV